MNQNKYCILLWKHACSTLSDYSGKTLTNLRLQATRFTRSARPASGYTQTPGQPLQSSVTTNAVNPERTSDTSPKHPQLKRLPNRAKIGKFHPFLGGMSNICRILYLSVYFFFNVYISTSVKYQMHINIDTDIYKFRICRIFK